MGYLNGLDGQGIQAVKDLYTSIRGWILKALTKKKGVTWDAGSEVRERGIPKREQVESWFESFG